MLYNTSHSGAAQNILNTSNGDATFTAGDRLEDAGGYTDPPINLALNDKSGNGQRASGLGGPLLEDSGNVLESGKVCRICLEDEEDFQSGNPFITPCKCMGSMKYIHVKCLREWTSSKMQTQEGEGITSYYWENLQCELCKSQLDLVLRPVNDPNKAIFLLDLERPVDTPYLILESDIDCASKAIHILNLQAKKNFGVGRRVNCDISVSDISVSRQHANFNVEGNRVFVADSDSKFGTFKQIQGPMEIELGRELPLPVQIEKKCFFFKCENR